MLVFATACLGLMFIPSDREELTEIAESTWKYFQTATYSNGITDDHINFSGVQPNRTSPTNVAMYLFAVTCAKNMGFISSLEAENRSRTTLKTLLKFERDKGFFLNWYVTESGATLLAITDKQAIPKFLSSVDNAWLAAALIQVKHEYPMLNTEADHFLRDMDFRFFFDQKTNTFRGGYNPSTGQYTEFHYGILLSETRLINYVSASMKQVDIVHLAQLTRQRRDGVVLSCYGSMFEGMVVSLFLPEIEECGKWKEVLKAYAAVNIALTIDGVWGTSYSDDARGFYKEFGINRSAVFPLPYEKEGVVTPYASFLALQTQPEESMSNIRRLKPHCFTSLGFAGAYRPRTKEVSNRALTLDQGCIMMSIANYQEINPSKKSFVGLAKGGFPND